MIRSFKDKATAALFAGWPPKRLPAELRKRAREKLDAVHFAVRLDDLRVPPANRLEKFSGDREGQWIIRINAQWRVCFVWRDGDAWDVEIIEELADMSIRIEDLVTVDFSDVVDEGALKVAPTTPGELLRRDFMEPLGLSAHALADALRVPTNRVTGILNGTRAVTADTALRLARAFGTTPEFWLNAQAHYDMLRAQEALGNRLDEVRSLLAA